MLCRRKASFRALQRAGSTGSTANFRNSARLMLPALLTSTCTTAPRPQAQLGGGWAPWRKSVGVLRARSGIQAKSMPWRNRMNLASRTDDQGKRVCTVLVCLILGFSQNRGTHFIPQIVQNPPKGPPKKGYLFWERPLCLL